MKVDKADPGNCRRITLLSIVGRTSPKTCIGYVEAMVEKEENINEGQAGFGPNRTCIGLSYTLGYIIQERKDTGLKTDRLFLEVQKARATVWRNGLWKLVGETGIRG